MRVRMPSPRGTNTENLYIDRSFTGVAYDEALPPDAAAALLTFLTPKLTEEDLIEFCELAGIDRQMTMDNDIGGPAPFRGMPLRGGGKFGQDKKPGGLSALTRAAMARIKVSV